MSDQVPGVTVLLPVYFRRVSFSEVQLLRRALESVIEQGHRGPLEILVIDDGSPIPVESLAEELGAVAGPVRWLRLPRNRGIVAALNAGIAAARYELVARLDADDRWRPGKLAAQLDPIMADPDLTITATGMERVGADGTLIDTHIRPGDWPGILRFFVEGGCPFPHGSVLARRSIYQVLGGYPHAADVRHCEDYALWGIWLRFFKPAMVERALYEYRVSGASVSSTHAIQQSDASQVVRRRFADLDLATVLPAALPEFATALGADLITAGRVAHAMWHFGAAMALPEAALAPLAAILPDRAIEPGPAAVDWHTALGLTGQTVHRPRAVAAKPFR